MAAAARARSSACAAIWFSCRSTDPNISCSVQRHPIRITGVAQHPRWVPNLLGITDDAPARLSVDQPSPNAGTATTTAQLEMTRVGISRGEGRPARCVGSAASIKGFDHANWLGG